MRAISKLLYCLPLLGAATTSESYAADIEPVQLRCEHLNNPVGLDINTPRLSWRLELRFDPVATNDEHTNKGETQIDSITLYQLK